MGGTFVLGSTLTLAIRGVAFLVDSIFYNNSPHIKVEYLNMLGVLGYGYWRTVKASRLIIYESGITISKYIRSVYYVTGGDALREL